MLGLSVTPPKAQVGEENGCVTSWLSFRWERGQHRGVLLMDT